EWSRRDQGVFTYWLCRALEGGAARDGKGELTFEDVYDYVYKRVTATAKQVFGKEQTPVRWVGTDVPGTPVVLRLRPERPETLCRRLAEHMDLDVRARQLKKVGVLEFLVPTGPVLGLARAHLPSACASQVRTALAQLAGKDYVVLEENAFRKFA